MGHVGTKWVVQRLGDRWAAGFVDGRNGFHHKFDTLQEAIEQATWNLQEGDSVEFVDELWQPLPATDYLPG